MSLQNVLKLYKKLGQTPLEAIEDFRNKNLQYRDVPMTYAGRLDPMAEGLLLVLTGEECKKKEEYTALDKEYEGQILFGFQTDTGDMLGIPSKVPGVKGDEEEVKKLSEELVGKRLQKYPKFSSRTVEGKPLWKWSREGKEVERPSQTIEVYEFEILECRMEKDSDILDNIRMSVGRVRGDFRQEKILSRWQEILEDSQGEALVCKLKTKVSSGTYIRGLAEELGHKVGTVATLYKLRRTKIGDFELLSSS